jgi:hypothetical protein
MTITYPDGTTVQAILLSRSADTLRVAVTGDDDLRSFTLLKNTWISESCEPVTIGFEWQTVRHGASQTESECVCSKQLASRLIAHLVSPERDVEGNGLLYVFSGAGRRITVQQSKLHTN